MPRTVCCLALTFGLLRAGQRTETLGYIPVTLRMD